MTQYVASEPDGSLWNSFVSSHPDGHILQSAEWGKLKSAFGWSAQIVGVTNGEKKLVAGALILFRLLPLRLGTLAYIPAGPLFAEEAAANQTLWEAIDRAARQHRAAFVKVEPCDWYRPRPALADQLKSSGLRPSPQTIQPPRTIIIDLVGGEEAVLKRMNQSTRRKVRSGAKNAVEVRIGKRVDVASFNAMMSATGARDAFGTHDPNYYQMAFDLFSSDEHCALILASHEGRDLAGIMVFRCGENAYYLYGASSNENRNLMGAYIAQWEAIRWAMQHGAIRYDLWGVPDFDEAQLEADFESRKDSHDGLWGVYGAKRGYGGQVVRSVGAWDKVYNPVIYKAYELYLKVGR